MMSIDTFIQMEHRDQFRLRIDLINKKDDKDRPYLVKRLKKNLARIAGAEWDEHDACFAFPNCDLSPSGCIVAMGDDVECIGHRG